MAKNPNTRVSAASVNKQLPKKPPKTSRWHKGVLIPFWVLQIIATGIVCGLSIAALVFGRLTTGVLLLTIFSLTDIALLITEIVLFAKGKLHTITYLVFQCVKMGLWLILVILVIVSYVTIAESGSEGDLEGTGIGLILTVIIFLLFIGTLIYGSVIHHRHRVARRGTLKLSDMAADRERYFSGPYAEAGLDSTLLQAQHAHSPSDSIHRSALRNDDVPPVYKLGEMEGSGRFAAEAGGLPITRQAELDGQKTPVWGRRLQGKYYDGLRSQEVPELGLDEREMPHDGELYEMSAVRSMKSVKSTRTAGGRSGNGTPRRGSRHDHSRQSSRNPRGPYTDIGT